MTNTALIRFYPDQEPPVIPLEPWIEQSLLTSSQGSFKKWLQGFARGIEELWFNCDTLLWSISCPYQRREFRALLHLFQSYGLLRERSVWVVDPSSYSSQLEQESTIKGPNHRFSCVGLKPEDCDFFTSFLETKSLSQEEQKRRKQVLGVADGLLSNWTEHPLPHTALVKVFLTFTSKKIRLDKWDQFAKLWGVGDKAGLETHTITQLLAYLESLKDSSVRFDFESHHAPEISLLEELWNSSGEALKQDQEECFALAITQGFSEGGPTHLSLQDESSYTMQAAWFLWWCL